MFVTAVIVGSIVGAAIYFASRYIKNKKNATSVAGKQTAFARIAQAEAKQHAAQGKIIAINAAAEAKQTAADSLMVAAQVAHAGLDEAHAALDEVHAILG